MNLRDLEYLLALHETHHFGQAAEKCFVSQPTLSGQLAKLEEQLGLQLVERTKRKVLFTSAGERIVERARQVQMAVKALQQEARQLTDPMCGELRLGLLPTVAPYLLPHVVTPLSEAYPELRPLLYEAQTSVLVEQLDKGAIDAAILAWLPEMERFAHQTLYQEAMYMTVHSAHPLASKHNVSLSDLQSQTVLMLEDGHCLREQALGYCFAAGATEDDKFRATSLETLRHMVAAGHGVTLLPQLAVQESVPASLSGIRYIPFSDPKPHREIAIVWRRGSGMSRSCVQVAEVITPAVRSVLD